ncbi:unnamed protein product [Lactuca saligna]|uniref:K-box domain-containing protein n=1 Tax=Lactuca saligna TaxID=75948 RepID=A0AA35YQY8_LACSI|nr:unnamed protein product [Lactuca saligna]
MVGYGLTSYCSVWTLSFPGIIKAALRQKRDPPKIRQGINTRFKTCNELLESVKRVDEQGNDVTVSDMIELEKELNAALMHTRSRKTQLMMERISSLHEQCCAGKEIKRRE